MFAGGVMEKEKIIVFQGDSVTDAGRNRDQTEPNRGLGPGYPLLVAARLLAERPHDGLKFYNRGISGNRVVDLYARWKIDTLNYKPDLISILIGVNDTWHEYMRQNGVEVERYAQVYRMLLGWTLEVLPDVKLVLIEPFILPGSAPGPEWFAEMEARRAVVRELAEEYRTGFVAAQEILSAAAEETNPEYYLADGVHPTAAGHQLIADAWIREVKKRGFLA